MVKELLKRSPNNLLAHVNLAALNSATGREEEARYEAEEVLKLDPEFSLDKWEETVYSEDEALLEQHIDALRKAGLK